MAVRVFFRIGGGYRYFIPYVVGIGRYASVVGLVGVSFQKGEELVGTRPKKEAGVEKEAGDDMV